MRFPLVVLAVAALVAAPALAGCFGAKSGLGDPRVVKASGTARVGEGWAYDGKVTTSEGATFEGTFNNKDNTGSAVSTFMVGGQKFKVEFDQFSEAPGKKFQDGGVAFDFDEHGATGNGDAALPMVRALVAAWGEARVSVNDQPTKDPATGGATWMAHVMALDTTVRGADGLIAKADGKTPYDPKTPADARVENGKRQLILSVKSHPANASAKPFNDTKTVNVAGPQDAQSFKIPATIGARIAVNVTLSGAQGPLGAGQATFSLKSPKGTEVGTLSLQYTPQGDAVGTVGTVATEAGDYVLEARAQGVFTYSVAMSAKPMLADAFVTVTFDAPSVS